MTATPGRTGTTLPPLTIKAQLRWELVRPLVEDLRPVSIIEIGVGEGAMSTRLAMIAPGAFVGCELDGRSWRKAVLRVEPLGARIHHMALEELDPEPADLLCAFEVLEHLEDDAAALRTWRRYVRPGGTLLLSVPADQSRFGPSDRQAGHHRRYDPPVLQSLLESSGFTGVTIQRYGAPLCYALDAVRNAIDGKRLASSPAGETRESLTAASGRTFQFAGPSWKSRTIGAAVTPFARLQRVWPGGTGLVVTGRRPLVP